MTEQQSPDDIPDFITPKALYDMSSDALDALLEGIRKRRLEAARHYEAAVAAAKEVADTKARAQLLKQAEMLANALERIEKAMEAAETRVTKIRALRLELGIE